MSSVLEFCITLPLIVVLIDKFWGLSISSAVTKYGPIGANVGDDFPLTHWPDLCFW